MEENLLPNPEDQRLMEILMCYDDQEAPQAIKRLGDKAVVDIIRRWMRSGTSLLQIGAIYAIRLMGEQGTQLLHEGVQDPELHLIVLLAVLDSRYSLTDKEVHEFLRVILTNPDPDIRRLAVVGAAIQLGSDATQILREVEKNDPNALVRQEAKTWREQIESKSQSEGHRDPMEGPAGTEGEG